LVCIQMVHFIPTWSIWSLSDPFIKLIPLVPTWSTWFLPDPPDPPGHHPIHLPFRSTWSKLVTRSVETAKGQSDVIKRRHFIISILLSALKAWPLHCFNYFLT
jgi:hypothetical protein